MRIIISVATALYAVTGAAVAQQSGGVLHIAHRDSPSSMSMHEEGTNSVATPMMAVFNNLVFYDQHTKQNSQATIRSEPATEWRWHEDYTRVTFTLRQGVKWHDGKRFTAKDVQCTWWEIDRWLQEDVARPIIMHGKGVTCWNPKVHNATIMVNSIYNGWRFEDVWLEK